MNVQTKAQIKMYFKRCSESSSYRELLYSNNLYAENVQGTLNY